MRTLHVGLRVADLERSIAFCTAVGDEVVGDVPDTELVEWPAGHADGMTAADLTE